LWSKGLQPAAHGELFVEQLGQEDVADADVLEPGGGVPEKDVRMGRVHRVVPRRQRAEAGGIVERGLGAVDQARQRGDGEAERAIVAEIVDLRAAPALPHVPARPRVLQVMVRDCFHHQRFPLAAEEVGLHSVAFAGRHRIGHALASAGALDRDPVQVLVEAARLRHHVVGVEPADVGLVVVAIDGIGVGGIGRTKLVAGRPVPERVREVRQVRHAGKRYRAGLAPLGKKADGTHAGVGQGQVHAIERDVRDQYLPVGKDREIEGFVGHARRQSGQVERFREEAAMLGSRMRTVDLSHAGQRVRALDAWRDLAVHIPREGGARCCECCEEDQRVDLHGRAPGWGGWPASPGMHDGASQIARANALGARSPARSRA